LDVGWSVERGGLGLLTDAKADDVLPNAWFDLLGRYVMYIPWIRVAKPEPRTSNLKMIESGE
jgi:hypothetical protein